MLRHAAGAGVALLGTSCVGAAQPRERTIVSRGRRIKELDPADFGVRAGRGVDNSNALIAMRNHTLREPDTTWRLVFQPGLYQYQNNRWLMNVYDVELIGYGAEFQNISPSGESRNSRPMNMGDLFADTGDVAYGDKTQAFQTGHRIQSAAAGDTAVTLVRAADAGNYQANERILLHGYDQQLDGYPPNLRYFDYNTIIAVDEGVLKLDEPLLYDYDERWWDREDFYGAVGKPRVLSRDRRNQRQPKRLKVAGATFLLNVNPDASRHLWLIAERLWLEDVTVQGDLTASSSRYVFWQNVTCDGCELDKTVERAYLLDSSLGDMTEATGIRSLRVRGANLGHSGDVRPRGPDMWFLDCRMTQTERPVGTGIFRNIGLYSVERVMFHGCVFDNPHDIDFTYCVDNGRSWSYPVGAVRGTTVRIPWDAGAKDLARLLTPNGRIEGGGGSASLVQVYDDDAGNLVVELDRALPIAEGENITVWSIKNTIDGGGNRAAEYNGRPQPLWRHPDRVTAQPYVPPGWRVGERVAFGDERTYQGKLFVCTTSHVAERPPPTNPDLWQPVQPTEAA